jgi:type VI secretion system protein ImpK
MSLSLYRGALLDSYTELLSYVLYLTHDPSLAQSAEAAAAIIDQLLTRSRNLASDNGFEENLWLEGLYPVAAWVDEQLLSLEWAGRDAWIGKSLQRRYFNTTLAGRDFFVRLDQLEESNTALREVYDICLALGFRGQFFDSDDTPRLKEIAEKNLSKYIQDLPLQMESELFPFSGMKMEKSSKSFSRFLRPLSLVLMWLLPIAFLIGLYFWLHASLQLPG